VPLLNKNSYAEDETMMGKTSIIALNRFSEIQYRLDNGPSITAL